MYYLHACVNIKKIGNDTLEIFMKQINKQESMYETFHRLHPNNGFLLFDQSKRMRKPINIQAFEYFYNTYYQSQHSCYLQIIKLYKNLF